MRTWCIFSVLSMVTSACFPPALPRPDADAEGDVDDGADDGEDTAAPDTSEPDTADTVAPDTLDTDAVDADALPDVDLTSCEGRPSGSPCDDGLPCTREDRCSSQGRCEGIPYACDDGISCTEDRCDGVGGCTYPLAEGACLIGGTCFSAGQVKADDPCRVCAGGQAWSPNDGGACEDGDTTCTLGDTCEGFVCVGGPRPSDAATDWALRPLRSVTPSASSVVGIGRAVLDPLIVTEGAGPTTLSTHSGERELSGSSVAVLRRASSGLIPILLFEGFESATVSAFAPNFAQNNVALAVRHRGTGWVEDFAGTRTDLSNESTSGRLIYLDTMTNQVRHARVWPYRVEALSLKASSGFVSVSGFTSTFTLEELTDINFSNVGVGGMFVEDLAVVSHGQSGWGEWAAHIGSVDFFGKASVCTTASGGAVVSTAFTTEVTVWDTSRTTSVSSASPYATYLVLWFNAQGEVTATQAPFEFSSDPEVDGIILPGPAILACTDSDATLLVGGTVQGSGLAPYVVVPTVSGQTEASMLRLSSAGAILGVATFAGATPSAVFDRQGLGTLLAWVANPELGQVTDFAGTTVQLGGSSGVLAMSPSGGILWSHALVQTTGFSVIRGLAQLPQRGIVMGGMTLFVPTAFRGVDSEMTLPLESDISGFVLGLGTSGGLTCEYGD